MEPAGTGRRLAGGEVRVLLRQLVHRPRWFRPGLSLPAVTLLAAVVLAAGVPAATSGAAVGNARSSAAQGGAVLGQADLVSCPSAGNCVASGVYTDQQDDAEPFLVIQRGGRWGRAFGVVGNLHSSFTEISSLSCA